MNKESKSSKSLASSPCRHGLNGGQSEKNYKFWKAVKFVALRGFYIFLGVGIFLSIYAVKAGLLDPYSGAGDPELSGYKTSSGIPLTSELWNGMINYVDAATSGSGSIYTGYGVTTCAAGWTVAYTGQMVSVGNSGDFNQYCLGSSRTNRNDGETWGVMAASHTYLPPGNHNAFTKMIDCVVCVK